MSLTMSASKMATKRDMWDIFSPFTAMRIAVALMEKESRLRWGLLGTETGDLPIKKELGFVKSCAYLGQMGRSGENDRGAKGL